ncbi:hypothetical protein [Neisseria animalis]|nr:hypothetical protein [Neisseria animalis]
MSMEKWQAMFAPKGIEDALAQVRYELSLSPKAREALEDFLYVLWAGILHEARGKPNDERIEHDHAADALAELAGMLFSPMNDKGVGNFNIPKL